MTDTDTDTTTPTTIAKAAEELHQVLVAHLDPLDVAELDDAVLGQVFAMEHAKLLRALARSADEADKIHGYAHPELSAALVAYRARLLHEAAAIERSLPCNRPLPRDIERLHAEVMGGDATGGP